MRLAARHFTRADQLRFASLSGDRNPMHIDALQARRTQAGAPVVHGIHMLLWALDSLAATQPSLPPFAALRTQFSKFVYLDEPVDLVLTQQSATGVRLSVVAEGAPRSKINIAFGDVSGLSPAWASAPLEEVPYSPAASELSFEQMSDRSGRLAFQMLPTDAAALFPAATRWLGAQRIAAIAATTHLVGMICPGLHSVYSELSLIRYAGLIPEGFLAFRVTQSDPRFRSVEQEIAGSGLTGTVFSSARIPPVQQASMESLAGLVTPTEFAGSTALIVGGSRGLGELAAKLISAGGGHVVITWQSGQNDAERVVREICSVGGKCESLAYDARKSTAGQLASLADAPTHAYYFATPTIYRPQAKMFSADRLNAFLSIYVDGFWKLTEALRARQPNLSLFYPSSIFVTERPQGMTEYAMAKAAGEVLCGYINEVMAPTHVSVVRLPRLLTDQTSSVATADLASPLETMLPVVREVQSWPR
jgi:NAD(P)-dependent dehydrogenase (short-subunit alcohol dehydrogenase family)